MILEKLPLTIRNAVKVTRKLKRRFLWIDSLCIVQEGSDADFEEQAKRMEQVYSDAWCVLAASRDPGHDAGFLASRRDRSVITLYHHDRPFYICEAIDNFEDHVLNGALNKRGWVLQEHALARRTVYITDYQMYFQCGDGVRCETGAKMKNEIASFLGDANFPRSIQGKHQGLSVPSDRPMAIDSLQRRILAALNVKGGFDILDEQLRRGLLRRTLLWCRDRSLPSLDRIPFPPDRVTAVPPTWSWMVCSGAIDYINPPFGEMIWDTKGDLHSPWSQSALATSVYTDTNGVRRMTLNATAWEYSAEDGEGEIILDCPGKFVSTSTWCIVLGREHGMARPTVKKYYVLIVATGGDKDMDGKTVCERIGAGWLLGKCISDAEPGLRVSVF